MKKKTQSDGILVFDRYFGRKPSAVLLLVMRLVFCSAFSAACMLFVFSQYGFRTISLGYVGVVSALSAMVLSLLFIAFKRRYAVPALAVTIGFIIYSKREAFAEKLAYFLDEFMLLAEGRFIAPRALLFHDADELSVFNADYCDGMALGSFILCAAFGMLCAISMKRRIRALPAVAATLLLCVPRLLSEDLEFNALFIPVVLLTAACVAVSLNYGDGLAVVRSGSALYRSQLREEESGFLARTNKAGILKRISMQICYYSKYATSGMYCAVIFAAAVFTGVICFGTGEAIDYTSIFEYIEDLGDDDAEVTIDDDKVSDYFSGSDDKQQGLSISSPGRSNKSVIRVEFTGNAPIYLRGDIGVEFTGTGWITPFNDDTAWRQADFSDSYRPAELRILSVLLSELGGDELKVASESDVTIEYLTETDVVFLPAYTGDYSFYTDPNFDVYGDYCVRVSADAGSYINSVKCTALVNDFEISGVADEAKVIQRAGEILDEYNISVNDLYPSVVLDADYYDDVIKEYSKYVNENYLDVPESMRSQLSDFIWDSGLSSVIAEYYYFDNTSLFRYCTAAAIDEYLNTNYTYSLSNTNRGEGAVMRFLTETKQGHCSLYASAMTLMLRELGIPARYCTGFAVHPDTIKGSSKVFKEKDLHAWVEVYLDEFGWVTFDPTSAAVNALYAEDTSEAPAAQTTRPARTDRPEATEEPAEHTVEPETEQTEATAQVTEESDTDEPSGGTPERKPVPLKLIVGICAVLIAVLIAAVIIWHFCNTFGRADAAIANASRRSCTEVYNCIIDILSFHKLSPDLGELPAFFFCRADKQFNAGMAGNTQLLEAAAFSDNDSASADVGKLSEILGTLYTTAKKQSGLIKRYRICKIVISRLTGR